MATGVYTFRKRHRITHANDYRAAFDHRLCKSSGPLVVYARPNVTTEHRLGLSVPRRVGRAVDRVRIKRLIREAFRLERGGLTPEGCPPLDLVVCVKPHRALTLDRYRELLCDITGRLSREVTRRQKKLEAGGNP